MYTRADAGEPISTACRCTIAAAEHTHAGCSMRRQADEPSGDNNREKEAQYSRGFIFNENNANDRLCVRKIPEQLEKKWLLLNRCKVCSPKHLNRTMHVKKQPRPGQLGSCLTNHSFLSLTTKELPTSASISLNCDTE